ncbi:efflux RND transporter periplasmic adaptor subunit [Sphingosinicella humi]|uniref:Efflux RND transporter periplasmic adaptor subunit n=1 Tax=Allosphingosinicella humi TaxID=2068657 RepID=A0A2U2J0W9_9SPHN|nr:efflux RND transporter periplasmic adaptor subunit [Sphingosinicella humi]PWG01986.1 efflux RND transporter periplasmic adaptor subunit [Sphingosinicella humi]
MELTQDNKKLLAGGTAIALVAAIGGIVIGQSMSPSQPDQTAAAEAGEEGEEEGHGREGFVEMTPTRLQSSGIRTTEVEAGSLASEIIAQATVAAPPEGEAALTARADGAVVRINKRLGDPVKAGETVALIESRDAASFVAERSAAAARAQAARAAYAREKRLFEAKITARQDLEAAQAALAEAEAELRRTQAATAAANVTGNGRYLAVTSLISGRITEVSTQLGAYVLAGAELFHVANPNRIQIEASVPSVDAQRIRPGDPAIIELPGGGSVDAVVRSATPSLNPESRAATLVLAPSGTPAGLTQGQAVRVRIMPRGAPTDGRIVLPEEAVQSVEGRDVVFVRVKGGFQAVPVTVGSRSGGRIEILEGLKPGLQVVTQGAFVLKSQLGASEAGH